MTEKPEIKCENCRWYSLIPTKHGGKEEVCAHYESCVGEGEFLTCSEMRGAIELCGEEAEYYQEELF